MFCCVAVLSVCCCAVSVCVLSVCCPVLGAMFPIYVHVSRDMGANPLRCGRYARDMGDLVVISRHCGRCVQGALTLFLYSAHPYPRVYSGCLSSRPGFPAGLCGLPYPAVVACRRSWAHMPARHARARFQSRVGVVVGVCGLVAAGAAWIAWVGGARDLRPSSTGRVQLAYHAAPRHRRKLSEILPSQNS